MGSNGCSNIEAIGGRTGFQGRQDGTGRQQAARAARVLRCRLLPPIAAPAALNLFGTPTPPGPSMPPASALARFLAGAGALAADVDDLVQETFIRAFRALGRFRGQCQFRTWLMTIGGNVLKDAHRRSRHARVVPLGEDLRDTEGDPHERAVAGEAEQRLAAGLERLTRMQREVFLLRAQQGLEYQDIAAALGTTPGAARVHYHHAVKRLKEHMS